mmetsp:Transcript_28488/g.27460  ORF Transcript_28488/g.27460 Transcript_28488/m.27460 type:complete len:198 (-) Transcript_28488:1026-1619(-)
MEDKSTNYHNCRKASLLSQLFIFHKLLTHHGSFQENAAGILKSAENPVSSVFLEFARRYIESNSAYYDLLPFTPLLNRDARELVVQKLEEEVANKGDNVRTLRASINLYKLKSVFGLLAFEEEGKTLALVRQLQMDYLAGLKLDGKPEKGERKLADDLLLIINSVLEHFSGRWSVYYRVGLLEYGMEQSPYNFDLNL